MYLTRLVYVSRVCAGFNVSDIEGILAAAKEYNAKQCITGMLCFTPEYFLQCLEGGRANVNKLYQRILLDERHSDILLLDYQEIKERDFPEWSMGYIPNNKITNEINLKYSGGRDFNPYEMRGESCTAMMKALANSSR